MPSAVEIAGTDRVGPRARCSRRPSACSPRWSSTMLHWLPSRMRTVAKPARRRRPASRAAARAASFANCLRTRRRVAVQRRIDAERDKLRRLRSRCRPPADCCSVRMNRARADQQQQRHRHLRRDQRLAQPRLTAAQHAPRLILQRRRHARPRRLQRRREAEEHAVSVDTAKVNARMPQIGRRRHRLRPVSGLPKKPSSERRA